MSIKYRYIRANGRLLGSNSDYIDSEVSKAVRDKAPNDAWSYNLDEKRWNTLADLERRGAAGNAVAADTARRLRKIADG